MMQDREDLRRLRRAIHKDQVAGVLPYEQHGARRFQVLGSDVAVPALRELVTTLCLEGMNAYLVLALDEPGPHVGLHVLAPDTSLWIHPSVHTSEVLVSVRGGRYLYYHCDRALPYRGLTPDSMERELVEHLRLALCPGLPIFSEDDARSG